MNEASTTDARERIEAAWRIFARDHDLEIVACVAAPLDMRLDGKVRGVPLRIQSYRVSTRGAWPPAHLTVTGRAPITATGFVRATPATALSSLAARLGFARVETGDPEIDRTLFVEGVSGPSVRAMLPAHARAALLAFAADGAFEYEHIGATARITWEAQWPDVARLDAAIGVVVAACESDLPRGLYR